MIVVRIINLVTVFLLFISPSVFAVPRAEKIKTEEKPPTAQQLLQIYSYAKNGKSIILLEAGVTHKLRKGQPVMQTNQYVKPGHWFYVWYTLFVPARLQDRKLRLVFYRNQEPIAMKVSHLKIKKGQLYAHYNFFIKSKLDKVGTYTYKTFHQGELVHSGEVLVAQGLTKEANSKKTKTMKSLGPTLHPYEFSNIFLAGKKRNRLTTKRGKKIKITFDVNAPPGKECPQCKTFLLWGYYNQKGQTGGLHCAGIVRHQMASKENIENNCRIPLKSKAGAYTEGQGMKTHCQVTFTPPKKGTYYLTAQRLWQHQCKGQKFSAKTHKAWAVIKAR